MENIFSDLNSHNLSNHVIFVLISVYYLILSHSLFEWKHWALYFNIVWTLDCGLPPAIANAYSGLGPSTIGSVRRYACEDGYDMIGTGVIECLNTGEWSKPEFSCNGELPKHCYKFKIKSYVTTYPMLRCKLNFLCYELQFLNFHLLKS